MRNERPQNARCRGFILLIALAMVMLVSTAITLLARTASAEGHQRLDHANVAQIDQMLLAGMESVQAKLNAGAAVTESWKVELPSLLAEQGGELLIQRAVMEADRSEYKVKATLRGREALQRIVVVRDGTHWRLLSAELENG